LFNSVSVNSAFKGTKYIRKSKGRRWRKGAVEEEEEGKGKRNG
jgi:hypothetical protein